MYVRIAIIAVVFFVGWNVGSQLTKGRYEAQLRSAADMHRIAQDAAIKRASEAAQAESKRAVLAAEERGRRSVVAREVINEIHIAPDARDCDWTDDQRLRIERIYTTHATPTTAANGVPDPVQPSTETRSAP